jgi:ABC-type cobalamin/Fe3+-siderophores transport system ATPase subunit
MPTPSIEIKDLSLSIGKSKLLDGVSLHVDAGSLVALVGANGAGKTTLLKCLLGLMKPDAGAIEVNGKHTKQYTRPELARQLAYVPQLLEASVPFTVLDFVMMGRYAHESGFAFGDEEGVVVAKNALERINMSHFSGRSLQTLSGGERQKVCIAAALAQQSPILLLDEPSAHLDPRQREEVHEILSDIAKMDQLSILTVTHDLNWAAMDFDVIFGLKQGRVVVEGSSSEVMTQENLHSIFGVNFTLMSHPETGNPVVIPSVRKGAAKC